jgi:hypothetical protein
VRKVIMLLILVVFSAAALLGYRVWLGWGSVFPELPAGAYAGAISFPHSGQQLALYAQRDAGAREGLFVVGDPRLPAQRVALMDPSGRYRLAVVVSSADARLRFSGVRRGERFEGQCLDAIANQVCSWYLNPVAEPVAPEWYGEELRGWLHAVEQLQSVERSLEATQKRFDLQQTKMEMVGKSALDDQNLEKVGSGRADAAAAELTAARAQLVSVRETLDGAIRNGELAQRVSAPGRLVMLSRESLLRESRWVEITLKLLAAETQPGFDQRVERSNRVRSLQDEIDAEQRRIEQLERGERAVERERARPVAAAQPRRTNRRSREATAEEEFYREVQ